MSQGLEKSRADGPKPLIQPIIFAACQAQTHLAERGGGTGTARFHDAQDVVIQAQAHSRRVAQAVTFTWQIHVGPTPIVRPQVGGMNAIRTRQGLHFSVLRKQAQRRRIAARQHLREVLGQCKTGTLNALDRLLVAPLRVADKLLNHAFHGFEQHGGVAVAHHFQRAHSLVNVLPGQAKLAVVYGGQVSSSRSLGIFEESLEGFARTFQRLRDFVRHPCQCADVG